MNLDEAREALNVAAIRYAKGDDVNCQRALCEAASAYHVERVKAAPRAQMKESTTLTLPFGKEKGVRLNECKSTNLSWARGVIAEGIDNPDKARFREANVALLEAIDRELASR